MQQLILNGSPPNKLQKKKIELQGYQENECFKNILIIVTLENAVEQIKPGKAVSVNTWREQLK